MKFQYWGNYNCKRYFKYFRSYYCRNGWLLQEKQRLKPIGSICSLVSLIVMMPNTISGQFLMVQRCREYFRCSFSFNNTGTGAMFFSGLSQRMQQNCSSNYQTLVQHKLTLVTIFRLQSWRIIQRITSSNDCYFIIRCRFSMLFNMFGTNLISIITVESIQEPPVILVQAQLG